MSTLGSFLIEWVRDGAIIALKLVGFLLFILLCLPIMDLGLYLFRKVYTWSRSPENPK